MLALVVGSLSATGCLIAEAPSYGAPRRTVPVIGDVNPLPSLFLNVRTGERLPFTMNVRSEDAGESLVAVWVVDYEHPREVRLGPTKEVPPLAADQPKLLGCDFIPNALVTKGCHSLTLLVMHKSSYDIFALGPTDRGLEDDVAAITWFVNVENDGSDTPVSCPTE
jgi:hypothetical protein